MTTQEHTPAEARKRLLSGLPVTERRVELAGVSTAVLEGGEGNRIVLLHGPGESAFWWMRVIPDLVSTHRVIVPDLPGHGASEVIDNPLTADSMGAWLDALLTRTCPTSPTLVGHLLGGALAARYAADDDGHLDGLVLVDSLGLARFLPSPRFAFGLIRFLVRPTDRAYHSFLDQCMIDRDGLIYQMGDDWDPFLSYHLERSRTPSVKSAMRTLMKEIGIQRIPGEDLEAIAIPTTLIWGRDDRAIRLGIAQRASERYGWPLHVIDHAADDPKLEQPDAFLTALHVAMEASDRSKGSSPDS